MDMIIRPKTSRNHPMPPISIGALSKWMIATIIVMIFVREIEIVLVHWERDAPFKRLDEHLRVVLRIGPDNICGAVGQPGISDESGEGCTVELHIVAVH